MLLFQNGLYNNLKIGIENLHTKQLFGTNHVENILLNHNPNPNRP